jgi:serine/threonine-protein kinase RsbW
MDARTSARFRREPAAVPSARAFVAHALRSRGVVPEAVDSLVLAVAEACNNAILHADGDTFTVGVIVDGTTCMLSVSDRGPGFYPPHDARMPSPEATGRRGLPLMQALVDHVKMSSTPAGTTVVLVHDLAVSPAALVADG